MSLRSLLSFALVLPAFAMIGAAQNCAPLERNITDNGPSTSSGEPEIASNPTNPNNLFIDYATFPVPAPTIGPAPEHACGGFVSMDRGRSWQPSFLPFPTQSEVTSANVRMASPPLVPTARCMPEVMPPPRS